MLRASKSFRVLQDMRALNARYYGAPATHALGVCIEANEGDTLSASHQQAAEYALKPRPMI